MNARPMITSGFARHRALLIAAFLCAEVVMLAAVYQFVVLVDCEATGQLGMCRFLRSIVARALAVFAATALLAWAQPDRFARFAEQARRHEGGRRWMLLHFAGVALLLVPLLLAEAQDLTGQFATALLPWLAGAVLASLGGVLWIAPAQAWRDLFLRDGAIPLIVLGIALLVPDLADNVRLLWYVDGMSSATFAAVQWLLELFSLPVVAEPDYMIIGVEPFLVEVSGQCSGVEGLALMSAFTLLYAIVFRNQIRPLRFWLLVLPGGLLLSWWLNVVRIAVLVVIGARISPDLAVNAFHSYAGWMFFTLLAMVMLYAVQATPWLHVSGAQPAARSPLRQDWAASRILPFVVFMLASTVVSAFSLHPDVAYPVKTLALGMVLAWFWPVYRTAAWRIDPVAVFAGVAIGAFWLLSLPPPDDSALVLFSALAALSGPLLMLWIVARVIGTVLLVPVVEELFFRSYLLTRLSNGSRAGQIGAILISSALFALLHGRYVEAFLAGVCLAVVAQRRGRWTDAVAAHAIANAIIAASALIAGDWTRI